MRDETRSAERTQTYRGWIPLLAILGAALTALFLAGCSAGGSAAEESSQASSGDDPAPTAETSSETTGETSSAPPDTTAPQEETMGAEQGSGNAQGEDRNARVALRIEGDPGISFTGTCRVGGREETIEGETPQRQTYRLREGQPVNCEVQRTDGEGNLVLNLRSGGTVFNQESNGDAVLRASLNASEDDSTSTSSTSVNSSSSVQQSGGSSSSTSSSSVNVIRGDQSDE